MMNYSLCVALLDVESKFHPIIRIECAHLIAFLSLVRPAHLS